MRRLLHSDRLKKEDKKRKNPMGHVRKICLMVLMIGAVGLLGWWRSAPPLWRLASAVSEMQASLPGHYRLSVGVVHIRKDEQMGCWALLSWPLPEVEVFYLDDGILQEKHIPTAQWAEWMTHQRDAQIWLSERRLSRGVKSLYRVMDFVSEWEDKQELYMRLDDPVCAYHEAQKISVYGTMSVDTLHTLSVRHSEG